MIECGRRLFNLKEKFKDIKENFKKSEIPEDSTIGLVQGLSYVLLTIFFTVLLLPSVGEEGTRKVFEIQKVIFSSLLGTFFSFVLIMIYAFVSYKLSIFISRQSTIKRINKILEKKSKIVKYNFYNIICDTYYWVVKICDLLLSVLIPFLIALYFFENSRGKILVESIGALITISLMPTLIISNSRAFLKVIILGVKEIVCACFYLIVEIFVSIYLWIWIMIDKVKNLSRK